MAWKDNWGDNFEDAPWWAVEFAEWLSLPKEARPEDCVTIRQFAEKKDVRPENFYNVQREPEFKRLRRTMADANGITDAHRQAVIENLFNLAAYGKDARAIKTFLEVSGQLLPQPTVSVAVTPDTRDEDIDRRLALKFGLPIDVLDASDIKELTA